MRRLFAYMRRYRLRYAAGFGSLFATATIAMSIPWLLKRTVDAIEAGDYGWSLAPLVGAIVGLAVLQGIVRTFSRALIFNVGRDVEYAIRNDLFAHLEKLSLSFYQREKTGDLMSRLVNDIGAVRLMLGPGILNLVNTPIYYVYALTIMLTIDAGLTLLSVVAYPGVLWAVRSFSRKMMERTIRVQEGLASLSSRAQENLSGMGVIKAYALEDQEIERFREMNRDFRDRNLDLARVRGLIVPVMKIASNSGILVVLWYGGWQVMRGNLGIGDLVAFIGYLHLLAWPTMALGWMISIVQRGRAAMKRLNEIFDARPAVRDPAAPKAPSEGPARVAFEDVTFAYPSIAGGDPVLRNVSFDVAPGETVAVVGRTGAGKSSILQLVPRLFDADDGVVRLDGVDVRELTLRDLRRSLGVVPQDPFLFSVPLHENVGYGVDADAGDREDRIERAVELAGLGPDLGILPQGLDTAVGERGVTLSGGQKQRVTLARAIAAEPRLFLLDDALSSVDGETEQRILEGLREGSSGATWIIASHRMAIARQADRVLVVDEGRIVEEGTHDELLARGGLYHEIFQERTLEEEIETL